MRSRIRRLEILVFGGRTVHIKRLHRCWESGMLQAIFGQSQPIAARLLAGPSKPGQLN